MRDGHTRLSKSSQRILDYGSGSLQGMDCPLGRPFVVVHVAAYTPNQKASLVPLPSVAESVLNTTDESPPDGHNFLEGDIFILVSENDIILCPSGLRESAAMHYIDWIIQQGNPSIVESREYAIEPIASVDAIQMLRREGVSRIMLNASLYAATISYGQRNSGDSGILGSLRELALTYFPENNLLSQAERNHYANLSTRLEISFDGRRRGGEISGQAITDAAVDIFNQATDDGISIRTRRGNLISRDTIRISKQVVLPVSGNSVSKLEAWAEMASFLDELRSTGALSQ